jgi:hypothetical protein
MSRHALIFVLAAALAVAATTASAATAGTGIELVGGSGRATLNLRGALLGALERGRLAITTIPGRQRPEILVQGYEWQRAEGQTTIYGGDRIRFRVFRGAWHVRLSGSGINASAVGRGIVGLAGRGRYSLAGAPYRPWPAEYETIRLGGSGREG